MVYIFQKIYSDRFCINLTGEIRMRSPTWFLYPVLWLPIFWERVLEIDFYGGLMDTGTCNWMYRVRYCILFLAIWAHAEGPADTVPEKIFLIRRVNVDVDMSPGGMGTVVNIDYGYGFEGNLDYIIPVDYFGMNLLKTMKPVPEGRVWMDAYLWARIGAITGMVGGIGIAALGSFGQFINGAGKDAGDQRPASFNFTPLISGAAITSVGISLQIARHKFIRTAEQQYNFAISKRSEAGR